MMKLIKKFIGWFIIKIHSIILYITIALYNTENNILKADPNNLSEKDKKNQRKQHKNPVLEKFYAGQTDEKYVQQYYELLKKADGFVKNASQYDMNLASDKFGMSYGKKDPWGRRYEHYGFFDPKHKNAGKTMGEVINEEMEDRRTKDDDYKILHIFNNKPIEVGFDKVINFLDEKDDDEYEVVDVLKKSKSLEFPIKAYREEDVANKIEQLAEFLHVKKIGFDQVQLEFFIPLKFKIDEVEENSETFMEILNFYSIFVKDDYGDLIGFKVNKFKKRIIYNDTHEVWKFIGTVMENINKK
ncbi:MAG: hypothetical protein ACOC2W_01700 [bacterium]